MMKYRGLFHVTRFAKKPRACVYLSIERILSVDGSYSVSIKLHAVLSCKLVAKLLTNNLEKVSEFNPHCPSTDS